MRIRQVDEDFSYVHFLSDCGRFGSFQGEKMLLSEFIRRYPEFSFEIVDEHDGYQGLIYGGYFSLPEREKCGGHDPVHHLYRGHCLRKGRIEKSGGNAVNGEEEKSGGRGFFICWKGRCAAFWPGVWPWATVWPWRGPEFF